MNNKEAIAVVILFLLTLLCAVWFISSGGIGEPFSCVNCGG